MEIIADYPVATVIMIIICAFAFMIVSIILHDKKVASDNRNAAVELVDNILSQVGWESKQHWTDKDTMEFVTVFLGQWRPGHHRVWARMKVHKTSLEVIIEYAWNTDCVDRDWAEFVQKEFQRRKVPTTLRLAIHQPRVEEIRVPDPVVVNEFDEKLPPAA